MVAVVRFGRGGDGWGESGGAAWAVGTYGPPTARYYHYADTQLVYFITQDSSCFTPPE